MTDFEILVRVAGLIMQTLFNLLGRWLFPRQQDWEQRKSARILVFTVVFALALGLAVATLIRLLYYHKK